MIDRNHPSGEELIDYAHAALSEGDDARLHAHLATCSSCTEALEAETRLGELLREHARLQERELPRSLVESIYAAARKDGHAPPWWTRLAGALRPAVMLPAAAAIAIAIFLGFVSTRGTARATPIDAAYYLEDHAELATTVPFGEESSARTMLTSDTVAADERAVDETR